MPEDILQEEVISLKPIEKITAMVGEKVLRDEIREIKDFKLTRESLPLFKVIIRKELSKDLQLLSYIMERMMLKFRMYPDFNTYFTSSDEGKKDMQPKPMQIRTSLEYKQNGTEIMHELKEFVPTLMLTIDAAVEGLEQTWAMVAGVPNTVVVPKMVEGHAARSGVEWGHGKVDKAWLMSRDGKSRVEIATELSIEMKDVSSYIRNGLVRAAKFGIVQPVEESVVPELKKEEPLAEKPLEIK